VLAMASAAARTQRRSSAEDAELGAEYAADGLRRLLQQERRRPPLPGHIVGADLSAEMRAILVDWLVEVHLEYGMKRETLFLAVSILDRYMCSTASPIPRERLQLCGITALLIAAKFEEIEPLDVRIAAELTDGAYAAKDVLQTECMMLRALEFDIACPTPAHFMPLLQVVSRVHRKLDYGLYSFFSFGSAKVGELCDELATFLTELSLLEVGFTKHLPSMIASAAVFISNRAFGRSPAWPSTLEDFSGHSEHALLPVAKDLAQLLRASPERSLQQVQGKFPAVAALATRLTSL